MNYSQLTCTLVTATFASDTKMILNVNRTTAETRKPKSRETVVKIFFGESSPPFAVWIVNKRNVISSWDTKKIPKLKACTMPPHSMRFDSFLCMNYYYMILGWQLPLNSSKLTFVILWSISWRHSPRCTFWWLGFLRWCHSLYEHACLSAKLLWICHRLFVNISQMKLLW